MKCFAASVDSAALSVIVPLALTCFFFSVLCTILTFLFFGDLCGLVLLD